MANVFTAFGVGLFGLIISFGLLVIETITAKYGSGGCKNIMDAYNYKNNVESSSAKMEKNTSPVFKARGANLGKHREPLHISRNQ